jgi:hypothetical protein
MPTLIDTNPTQKKRKERSDKGKILLTDRDLYCLLWIGEQYAIRFDQLQKLVGVLAGAKTPATEETVRGMLKRWQKIPLVEVEKVLYKEPRWIWLTREGMARCGLPYKAGRPSTALLQHIYWVNQVRFYMLARYPDGIWTSERALRFEHGNKGHFPDGLHQAPDELIVPEIEITRKKPERLAVIMRDLVRDYKNAKKIYFTLPETHEIVRKAVFLLPEAYHEQFRVYSLEVTRTI